MKLHNTLPLVLITLCLFLHTSISAQHYWVGGSGDWSDFAQHWATTSGGSTFHTTSPTFENNVIFDVNSFTSSGQAVTMDLPQGECLSMTWTGVTYNPGFISASPNLINVYGSITLSPDMTCNLRIIELESDNTGNTITTSGTSLGSNAVLRLRGEGVWSLMDVLSVHDFQMESGTFNSNGNTINCEFSFETFSTPEKTLNLGSSHLNIASWRAGGSNNTFDLSNTTITAQIFHGDPEGNGPYTYGDLIIEQGGLIYGSSTFNTLTFISELGYEKVRIESGAVLNCNQLMIHGTKYGPLDVHSVTPGEHATINQTNGTVDGIHLILTDIHVTGGAAFNANSTEDLGNNDGWNITNPEMRNYYWVGNEGSWSEMEHWATSSGGSTTYNDMPTRYDNLIFDANSITEENVTISVDTSLNIRDINCTEVLHLPKINAPYAHPIRVFGSAQFTSNMIGYIYNLNLGGYYGGQLIDFGTELYVQNIQFGGPGGWTLMSEARCNNFNLSQGTLNTNNQTIHCFTFDQSRTTGTSLSLGNSEIFSSRFKIHSSSADFKPEGSHIHAKQEFKGKGFEYNEVTFEESLSVTNQNTYKTLNISPGATVVFEADSTQTITETLNLSGTPEAPISLSTTQSGTQASLSMTTGTVDGTYLILEDMNATGGAIFNATQSIDNGNNTGWNITEVMPLDFYWVGGTGDWSDHGNHWAMSSAGNIFHPFSPGPLDDVFFDANSFTEDGQTVTIDLDQVNFNNMSWQNVTHNPSFYGGAQLMNIYGSLAFDDDMTVNIKHYNFLSDEPETIDFGNPANPGSNSSLLFDGNGEWTLQDSMSTREFKLNSGSFNSNGNGMHISFTMTFDGTDYKELNLGSSNIFARSISWNGVGGNNLKFNGQNSNITCSGSIVLHSLIDDPTVEISLNALHFINQEFDNGLIYGPLTLNTLTLGPGTTLKLSSGHTISVNQLVAIGTNDDFISIYSSFEGNQATISQTEGVVDGQYLILQDIAATGGAEFNANSSINNGNVSGWTFFKQPQSLDFPPINDKLETDGSFTLMPIASSGLTVDLEVISGPASLNGNVLTLTGAGEVQIKASQDGDIDYDAAPSVIQFFCSNPIKPQITIDNSDSTMLMSNRIDGNQWLLNGNAITDATSQTYQVTQTGTYTVQVIIGNCASETSDPVEITTTGTQNWLPESAVTIFPNPTSDIIYLKANDAHPNLDYFISNMEGEKVQQGKLNLRQNENNYFDVSALPNGLFTFYGKSDLGIFKLRFAKIE